MIQSELDLLKIQVQVVEETKQLQGLLIELDTVNVKVQAVEEIRLLLEEERQCLQMMSERWSTIFISDSSGKEKKLEPQFCAHPVVTHKISSQSLMALGGHPVCAPQIIEFTTYPLYIQAELVELGKEFR